MKSKVTNKPQPNRDFWINLLVSTFLYWTVPGAAYFYFFSVEDTQNPKQFYEQLPLYQSDISSEKLKQLISDTAGSSYEKMVVRSAFQRYQMDPGSDGIFHKYMEFYQSGRWSIPPSFEWELAFSQVVDAWETLRERYIAETREALRPALRRNSAGAISLSFENNRTFEIGRYITLRIAVPSEEVIKKPAYVLVQLNGMNAPVEMLANWGTATTLSGKATALLEVNLSTVLEWHLVTASSPVITISGPGISGWDVLTVQLGPATR